MLFYVGTVLLEYREQESVDKGVCRNKYDFGTFALHSFSRATVPSIVFYNLHNCAAVHFIEADNSSYLCSNRKDSTYIYMKNIAETYWKRKKMPIPICCYPIMKVEMYGAIKELSIGGA